MTNTLETKNGYRWIILSLSLLSTAIGLMVWISAFPLLNLWVRDLGISHTQGGLLVGLGYVPGMLVALPSVWLFNRLPLRRVFLLGWLLIVAGSMVMATAPVFWVLCAGRLLMATGANVHMVGTPKMLAAWFEGRKELGLVMGLFAMSMTIGGLCGISLAGKLGHDLGWRPTMQVLAALAVVGLVALAMGVRQAPSLQTQNAASAPLFQSFKMGWAIWVLAGGYFFFSIGTDGFLAFTPDYLVERGYALDRASLIVGSYAWAAILLEPLFASFLKRRNAVWFAMTGCVLAMLANALLLQGQFPPMLSAIAIGVAMAAAFPAFFALPAFMLVSEKSGLAYGLFQFLYSFGVVSQTLIGLTIDRTGGHFWGYGVMMFYLLIGLACTLTIRRFVQKAPPEDTSILPSEAQ